MLTAVFWKKAWSWAKHHWYFPVIILLIIIFIVLRPSSTKRLLELMSARRAQYKKEINLLNETAEEKKQKSDAALKSHQEALKNIEREHELKVEELKTKKREELDTLIKDLEDKPEELAREVAKLLGAEHVE